VRLYPQEAPRLRLVQAAAAEVRVRHQALDAAHLRYPRPYHMLGLHVIGCHLNQETRVRNTCVGQCMLDLASRNRTKRELLSSANTRRVAGPITSSLNTPAFLYCWSSTTRGL
jgi:hypothetical protein